MPFVQPSPSDYHVNRALTNLSLAFPNDGFVAGEVFPNIPVTSRSDIYFTYDRGQWNRDGMKPRAPATESDGLTYGISQSTYVAKRWALHKDIDDEVRANADSVFNLDREATEILTRQALISREVAFAAAYFTTGIWTTTLTGVASAPGANQTVQWNDAASTPIEDVRRMKTVVRLLIGVDPNVLVLGRQTWDALVDHPDIVARIDRGQTTGPALANLEAVAAIMGLEKILVMEAIKNTANEGATNVSAFIGGKSALLVYAPARPGIMTVSGGYTFSWTGFLGATPNGWRIKKFRLEQITSDRIEIEQYYAFSLISADAGVFFPTIVA